MTSRNHMATPQALFDWANQRWGPFTLDAAASQWNSKCKRFYSVEINGLKQKWTGRVWLNCPWNDIAPWIYKAREQTRIGNAELVVMLLPTRTGQAWYQEIAKPFAQEKLIRGRVKFGAPPGQNDGSGGFEDCAFYIFERLLYASDYR